MADSSSTVSMERSSSSRNLQTRSPTDDTQVSPISKLLLGDSRRKRSRSQALNAVIANARTKKVRENGNRKEQMELQPILEQENATAPNVSAVEKVKERVRKLVLVPLSPNVPRIMPTASSKKTPRCEKTPKADRSKTPKSASIVASTKKSMFDVLEDVE